jgi:hypothetical protein
MSNADVLASHHQIWNAIGIKTVEGNIIGLFITSISFAVLEEIIVVLIPCVVPTKGTVILFTTASGNAL